MFNLNTKKLSTMLLSILLTIAMLNTAAADSQTSLLYGDYKISSIQDLTQEDKNLVNVSLRFLEDVVNVDLNKYYIKVYVHHEAPGVELGKTLKFNLSSTISELGVTAEFTNNKLFFFTVYPVKGTQILNEIPVTNTLAIARDTIDSLQAFSAEDYLPTFKDLLNSVTKAENSSVTNSGYTQKITTDKLVTISWEPYANGLSSPQNKLMLEFQNGTLVLYSNYLGMYNIGSTDIKISEAKAIEIAAERARAFTYTQDNQRISNITVLDKLAHATIALNNRGNNTLYPKWNILLPLDKEYPGGITSFRITIWADTGEVSYFTPIGFYGDINPATSPEPQQSAPTSSENGTPMIEILLICGALIAAITMSCLLFKKRMR